MACVPEDTIVVSEESLAFQHLPDDLILRIFGTLSSFDLAAMRATCKFFATHSPGGHAPLTLTDAAARTAIMEVWGKRMVCRSWLVAMRLTELPVKRPGGGADIQLGVETEQLEQFPFAGPAPSDNAPCSVCGLRGNSWLNLTDGSVLCGRRQYDGSGGNSHALAHFRTSELPLAVKLGTIVADLSRGGWLEADVFSYPENNMVADPQLAAHLAHFGIDAAANSQPTARSVAGLGLDARAHFHSVLSQWIRVPEDSVGPMFASFHPMAQDMLIQEYRRQMRAYHALQRRLAGCGSSGTGAGGGWRPPRRGEPDAPGGPEADHLGLERDAAAADQEALYAEMPLEELEELCRQEPSLPGFGFVPDEHDPQNPPGGGVADDAAAAALAAADAPGGGIGGGGGAFMVPPGGGAAAAAALFGMGGLGGWDGEEDDFDDEEGEGEEGSEGFDDEDGGEEEDYLAEEEEEELQQGVLA